MRNLLREILTPKASKPDVVAASLARAVEKNAQARIELDETIHSLLQHNERAKTAH